MMGLKQERQEVRVKYAKMKLIASHGIKVAISTTITTEQSETTYPPQSKCKLSGVQCDYYEICWERFISTELDIEDFDYKDFEYNDIFDHVLVRCHCPSGHYDVYDICLQN